MTKLSSSSIKAAACIAAGITLGVGAIGCPAKAVIINVGGTNYDVRTQTIDYDTDPTKFNTTDMPWWNNNPLAGQFASALLAGNPLGYPNTGGTFAAPTSPLFGYSYNPAGPDVASYGVFDNAGTITFYSDTRASNLALVYAYTVPITPPSSSNAPAPLPILGAAAAFAWGRKIRARLNMPTL